MAKYQETKKGFLAAYAKSVRDLEYDHPKDAAWLQAAQEAAENLVYNRPGRKIYYKDYSPRLAWELIGRTDPIAIKRIRALPDGE